MFSLGVNVPTTGISMPESIHFAMLQVRVDCPEQHGGSLPRGIDETPRQEEKPLQPSTKPKPYKDCLGKMVSDCTEFAVLLLETNTKTAKQIS